METWNFDVVGVRAEGLVIGYVRRADLKPGLLGDSLCRFRDSDVMAESESPLAAIQALKVRSELFINVLGQVGAIVTKGDLQKAPIRLWLFGVISLIEMQMLRLIRERLPDCGCDQSGAAVTCGSCQEIVCRKATTKRRG